MMLVEQRTVEGFKCVQKVDVILVAYGRRGEFSRMAPSFLSCTTSCIVLPFAQKRNFWK